MTDRIATADIPFGNVYAYRKGDRVSSEAVEANGWEDYVSTPSSKSGKQAVADATGTTSKEN